MILPLLPYFWVTDGAIFLYYKQHPQFYILNYHFLSGICLNFFTIRKVKSRFTLSSLFMHWCWNDYGHQFKTVEYNIVNKARKLYFIMIFRKKLIEKQNHLNHGKHSRQKLPNTWHICNGKQWWRVVYWRLKVYNSQICRWSSQPNPSIHILKISHHGGPLLHVLMTQYITS